MKTAKELREEADRKSAQLDRSLDTMDDILKITYLSLAVLIVYVIIKFIKA